MSFYCNIALSFYGKIACENRSSDEGLRQKIWQVHKYFYQKYTKTNDSFFCIIDSTLLTRFSRVRQNSNDKLICGQKNVFNKVLAWFFLF